MKIAIMQPYFFPYVGYWQLIKSVDTFVLLDDVNFINRGWINRNRILLNGQPYMITLPLIHASQNRQICDLEINTDKRKLNKLLKTISEAYAGLPGRDLIIELAEQLFYFEGLLADALHNSICRICDLLAIHTPILRSSQLEVCKDKTGYQRLISITRHLAGDTYVNPPGGRELYSHAKFKEAGLNLKFLQPGFTPYPQKSSAFIAGLSILDMLGNGIYSTACLNNFILVE